MLFGFLGGFSLGRVLFVGIGSIVVIIIIISAVVVAIIIGMVLIAL